MPTYTLKSNATTAAAIVGFISDNGLINLVGGGAVSVVGANAGTATGANAISTYAGHPAYGDAAIAGNFLTAEAALGIVAGEKFAVLQVGHYGATANNDVYSVDAPAGQFRFGTKYNAAGAYHGTAVPGWGVLTGGLLSAAGYAHPDPDVFRSIWGREASGAIRTYINEFATTAATTNSTITNAVIAAGTWEFGGSVQGDAKIGIQIFMVFKGVSPDELATYLGADPYAALFDAAAAPQVVFTGTVPAQTGVVGTAGTALALASYFSAGTAPYAYSVQAGSLPSGLSLNASTGAITGTPTSAGTYAATIRATDSTTPTATTADTNSIGWTISLPAATATTLSGPTGGQVGVASAPFTVGANGAIAGTVTVTPSDGGGGGTFSPTSVAISAGTPTATFTYTPGSAAAASISISDTGSLTDAASLTYTASTLAATLTSSPLKNNTGTLLTSAACDAYVSNPTTGSLVVKKTGLTTNGTTGIASFSDGTLAAGSAYRVVWRMTTGGAEGLETLTAT